MGGEDARFVQCRSRYAACLQAFEQYRASTSSPSVSPPPRTARGRPKSLRLLLVSRVNLGLLASWPWEPRRMSIRQEIVKWADELEEREKRLLDNLERELEQTEVASHRNRLQIQIAATKVNIARRQTFRAYDGVNNQCPDCWMSEERRSPVRAISF